MPGCGGYGIFDYQSYMDTVNRYKNKGYCVFAGAEIDYAHSVERDILGHLTQKHYDYAICSVHMINGLSVSTNESIKLYEDKEIFSDTMEKYYKEVMYSLRVKEFDVIGHIGIYKRYLEESFISGNALYNRIRELDEELAKACALSDKIIEVNSSGLFSPFKSALPDAAFLKAYFDFGGRRVCMGSDAHSTSHLCRGFEEVKAMLKSIGFHHIFLPWNKAEGIRL